MRKFLDSLYDLWRAVLSLERRTRLAEAPRSNLK